MIWNRTDDHEMIFESKSGSNGAWERNVRTVRRVRISIAALYAILISLCSRTAGADMITITGNLTCNGSALACGIVQVPLDYNDLQGAKIDIALVRFPAKSSPGRRYTQ